MLKTHIPGYQNHEHFELKQAPNTFIKRMLVWCKGQKLLYVNVVLLLCLSRLSNRKVQHKQRRVIRMQQIAQLMPHRKIPQQLIQCRICSVKTMMLKMEISLEKQGHMQGCVLLAVAVAVAVGRQGLRAKAVKQQDEDEDAKDSVRRPPQVAAAAAQLQAKRLRMPRLCWGRLHRHRTLICQRASYQGTGNPTLQRTPLISKILADSVLERPMPTSVSRPADCATSLRITAATTLTGSLSSRQHHSMRRIWLKGFSDTKGKHPQLSATDKQILQIK